MSYINVEECLAKIDESKINRYDYANVYAVADTKTMMIEFAYSEKSDDDFSIVTFEAKEIELTEELWQEILCVSKLIADRFDVELIVDDARHYSLDETVVESESITVTYQIDRCQKHRLQRLMDEFNSVGMKYSMQDTIQAVMTVFTESDVNKNLFFYEELLLGTEENADG